MVGHDLSITCLVQIMPKMPYFIPCSHEISILTKMHYEVKPIAALINTGIA